MGVVREFLSDGNTGKPSVKRLVLLIACIALSVATVVLACAGWLGRDVGVAIAATASPLAGLAGYGYVNGKAVERRNKDGGIDSTTSE